MLKTIGYFLEIVKFSFKTPVHAIGPWIGPANSIVLAQNIANGRCVGGMIEGY
jgi:hypothetical protein